MNASDPFTKNNIGKLEKMLEVMKDPTLWAITIILKLINRLYKDEIYQANHS